MAKMAAVRAFLGLAIVGKLVQLAMGTSFAVGGAGSGWDLNTDMQTWTSSKTFTIGDSLTFTYTSQHSVLEVSKADYDACQVSKPIQSYTGGTTVIKLSSPGKRYFICGTAGHCSAGMKLEITTISAATAAPPPATPPPASPAAPPPATPPPASPAAPPPATPPPASPAAPPPATPPPASPSSPPPGSPPTKSPAHAPSPLALKQHHAPSNSPSPTPSEAPSSSQEHHSPSVSPSGEPSRAPASDLPTSTGPTPQNSSAAGCDLRVKVVAGLGIGMLTLLLL